MKVDGCIYLGEGSTRSLNSSVLLFNLCISYFPNHVTSNTLYFFLIFDIRQSMKCKLPLLH